MFSKRHRIFLSLRQRPLPWLWLLVFLAPYLSFSLTAAPHFHPGELATARAATPREYSRTANSRTAHSRTAHSTPRPLEAARSSRPAPAHHDECFLCDWSASSHAQAGATMPSFFAVLTRPTAYRIPDVYLSIAALRAINARGPPLFL